MGAPCILDSLERKKVILIMNWKGYRSRWSNTELNIVLLCQAVFLVSGNGAFTDGIVFCASYLLFYDVISTNLEGEVVIEIAFLLIPQE